MNTVGTKRINDPEVRRRQILEEAMKLFYEKGYDNTSLDDIAVSLDITKGLCYRYFLHAIPTVSVYDGSI